MSCSPERISSYRRHFEDGSSSSYQIRMSSPSPNRRGSRYVSPGYSCRTGASSMRVESVRRMSPSTARRSRMGGAGVSTRAVALVCVGPTGEPPIDLDAAAAVNQEFLSTRKNERQEMIVLNDRLAVYVEKVRSLEQQNKQLETEIEAYQNRFEKPSGLRSLYEEQLRELRKIADQMRVQRDISLAAKESTAAQLQAIKLKCEEALELRKKAEAEIEIFRPDVDKATASRIALEKKLEQLQVDIEFLKRIHQQEIDELMKDIYAAQVKAAGAFSLPDLAAALKQIQTQYDDIAAKNLQEMDSWYQNKFEDLTKKTTGHVDRVRSIREEIANAKKSIQSKEQELDSLRTKNEALEAQIRETQEMNKKEIEDLQLRIETLQLELKTTKEKIALHLSEYQELLNIKMSLEIEITAYRKLIEGEDLRLSGMMHTMSLASCSMNAIGSGMSISGGGKGGVGSLGGDMIEGKGKGVGIAGGIGSGSMGRVTNTATGGAGGRMDAVERDNTRGPAGKAGGTEKGHHGFRNGGGVGPGTGSLGSGSVGSQGMAGGLGTGNGSAVKDAGGMGPGSGGLNMGAGSGGASTGAGVVDNASGLPGVGSMVDSKVDGMGVVGDTATDGRDSSGGVDRVEEGKTGRNVGNEDSGSNRGGGDNVEAGDADVAGMGNGSDGYNGNDGNNAEQAEELTERRTVLIRTVKNEDDVLETDRREQTYTISGAADDSDSD